MKKQPTVQHSRESRNPKTAVPVEALTAARRAMKKTQVQLGQEVHEILHGRDAPFNSRAAQNRVSFWETGKLRPTDRDISALAAALHRDLTDVRGWFRLQDSPTGQHLVLQVLDQLTRQGHKSLMILCANSVPAGAKVPELPKALVGAIQNGLTLALVVPFPDATISPEAPFQHVHQYHSSVRTAVRGYYKELQAALKEVEKTKVRNIGLFSPRKSDLETLVPPVHERYVLTIDKQDGSDPFSIARALYVWVTTRNLSELQFVEHSGQDGLVTKSQIWLDFLYPIFEAWKDNSYTGFKPLKGDSYWKAELAENKGEANGNA